MLKCNYVTFSSILPPLLCIRGRSDIVSVTIWVKTSENTSYGIGWQSTDLRRYIRQAIAYFLYF